jgi:hypothetical protein
MDLDSVQWRSDPAALFDGWEVVKEHSDNPVFFDTQEKATSYANAQAMMDGGSDRQAGELVRRYGKRRLAASIVARRAS